MPLARAAAPPPGVRVLAAVSGGPDSTALLLWLRELGADVAAAHYDHALRPGSERDGDHVAALRRARGPVVHRPRPRGGRARRGRARRLRGAAAAAAGLQAGLEAAARGLAAGGAARREDLRRAPRPVRLEAYRQLYGRLPG